KRIHNNLHGAPGDGGPLGSDERRHYEEILRANADELLALVRPRDIVLLHDPQTAGLGQALTRAGVIVVWRCHVGADAVNAHTERAWAFLRPYLDDVDAYVFSRAAYAPDWADPRRTFVIPPSIDPFSAKNQPMSPADVEAVLHYVGLLAGEPPAEVAAFTLEAGSISHVSRCRTRWRTRSSSTPFSATPPSSRRRASPRASGSRSPRPCGREGRSSPAPSAASWTRSSPGSTASWSRTLGTRPSSGRPCCACPTTRPTPSCSARTRGSGPRRSSSVTATSSSTRSCSRNSTAHAESLERSPAPRAHAGGAASMRKTGWSGLI